MYLPVGISEREAAEQFGHTTQHKRRLERFKELKFFLPSSNPYSRPAVPMKTYYEERLALAEKAYLKYGRALYLTATSRLTINSPASSHFAFLRALNTFFEKKLPDFLLGRNFQRDYNAHVPYVMGMYEYGRENQKFHVDAVVFVTQYAMDGFCYEPSFQCRPGMVPHRDLRYRFKKLRNYCESIEFTFAEFDDLPTIVSYGLKRYSSLPIKLKQGDIELFPEWNRSQLIGMTRRFAETSVVSDLPDHFLKDDCPNCERKKALYQRKLQW